MALFDGWRRLDGPEFHAIIAAAAVTGAWYAGLPIWWAAGINALGWVAWEVWQGVRDDKGPFPWSGRWGWRKRLEMIVPIISGILVTTVVLFIRG